MAVSNFRLAYVRYWFPTLFSDLVYFFLPFFFWFHGSSIAGQFCISNAAGYYLSVDTEKLVFPDSQWWTIDQSRRTIDVTNHKTSFHKHSLFFPFFSLDETGFVSLSFLFVLNTYTFSLNFFQRRFTWTP